MNSPETLEIDETNIPNVAYSCDVVMPAGLLGFEQIKNYQLIAHPAEEPFRRLRVKDNPALAFIVIEPGFILPGYQPDIPQADVDFLELTSPNEALLYNIVTLHGPGRATANLKGPIVINRRTGVAKQVVVANAAKYSVQHPLPVRETS
jgi:flagellar assembly factor FliW